MRDKKRTIIPDLKVAGFGTSRNGPFEKSGFHLMRC